MVAGLQPTPGLPRCVWQHLLGQGTPLSVLHKATFPFPSWLLSYCLVLPSQVAAFPQEKEEKMIEFQVSWIFISVTEHFISLLS